MKPVTFPEANVVFAKDQPQYLPLPAFRDESGLVITKWEFCPLELAQSQHTRCVYLRMHTFNQPLMPVMLDVVQPDELKEVAATQLPAGGDMIEKNEKGLILFAFHYLGTPQTVGQLRAMMQHLPDDTSFGFRQQPMQDLCEVTHDQRTFLVFQQK